MESLLWLDIGENKLTFVPEKFLEKSPDLREIYAYRNKIEFLSGHMFDNNYKLERLEFDQNRIKRVADLNLFRFNNLRAVCMRYNICVSKRFPDDINEYNMNQTITQNCSS